MFNKKNKYEDLINNLKKIQDNNGKNSNNLIINNISSKNVYIKKDKYKILAIPSDNWGVGNMRCIQPFRHLAINYNEKVGSKFDFKILSLKPNQGVPIEAFEDFDIVFLQRIIDKSNLEIIKQLKQRGKLVVVDVDDNLIDINPNNPFIKAMDMKWLQTGERYLDIFEESLNLVDKIIVTVPEIAQLYNKHYKIPLNKFVTINNAVELNHPFLQPHMNRRKQLPLDKIIFGVQLGSSHYDDLMIIQSIQRILDNRNDCAFAFCSNYQLYDAVFGSSTYERKKKTFFIPPVTSAFDHFPNLPSLFDIGLAPLTMDSFNDCKSWLKNLEFGIWNVPTICSPSPDYKRFNKISKGGNIIVNKNDINGFQKQIIKLIENPELRQKIGDKSRKIINEEINLDNYNKKRIKLFEEMVIL